ncbi:MAG: type II toxin-antitoxin system RelE/ParE family toxin, partial [Burkholderiaceae bacterium]|nr:type II toxin-antitoxin system RelE/ParE family toxin [Burkholderiaceae bacterium]
MVEIKQTETFRKWRTELRDKRVRAIIATRISRLAEGLAGDVRPVGSGVSELRIHYGSGYRIYFRQERNALVILLCGGDKSTQERDVG